MPMQHHRQKEFKFSKYVYIAINICTNIHMHNKCTYRKTPGLFFFVGKDLMNNHLHNVVIITCEVFTYTSLYTFMCTYVAS